MSDPAGRAAGVMDEALAAVRAGSADDPLEPQLRAALLPSYLLARRLGQGGMGSVYLAREPALKRSVAVKVMLPELARDENARARFEREAQAVAAISHPNVVSIYSVGALPDGTPYFVMQFVEGRSLEGRLTESGPLGVREARRVLGEVASALAATHKRGIVHRDIKTANVLQDEDTGRAIVTDFGIAAVLETEAGSARLTGTGMSLGTPASMSPEQLLGEPVTEKADVYSFGILAYELLTGAGPFHITSPQEAVAAHLRDTPPPLAKLCPDVDPALEHLVAGCLAKKPEERPTADQIVQQLAPGEHVLLEWPPPGLEPLVGRLPQTTKRMALGSALLVVSLLVVVLADPDAPQRVPMGLALGGLVVGVVLVLRALVATLRLLRQSRKQERQGHRWLTVVEVLCDRRGDGGALISGMAEYAPLAPQVRGAMRVRRVAAGVLGLAAAASPVAALALAVRAAASGAIGPFAMVVMTLAPLVILLAASWSLGRDENRRVRRPRAAGRKETRDVGRNVIESWTTSFDAARSGQALGTRTLSPALLRALALVLLLAVLAAGLVCVPLALVNPIGETLSAMGRPLISNALRRMRRAEVGRGFLPRQSVTADAAAAAGRALHSLEMAGGAPGPARIMRPAEVALHDPSALLRDGNPFPATVEFLQDTLIRRAARGAFNPAERAFLERLAADPGVALFGVAAGSGSVDVLGSRYIPAALDTIFWYALPLPRVGPLRGYAIARTAVAALRLSEHRPRDAETILRENGAVGLTLMDRGMVVDAYVGAALASAAMDRLETFYTVTGRSDDARRLRDARDSAVARAEREGDALERQMAGKTATAAIRVFVRTMLNDSTLPASLRWEVIRWGAGSTCINSRELLFGPMRETLQAFETFERQVLRSAADSALYRAGVAGFERDRRPEAGLTAARLGRGLFSSAGRALGIPRLQDCGLLLGIIG